jgi:DNA-directed RNA polymerase subunit RPC12/RpoP
VELEKVGDPPFRDSEELPLHVSSTCGYCGWRGLFDPKPEEYLPGIWADYMIEPLSVVYRCESCGKPHLATFPINHDPDTGEVWVEDKVSSVFPTGRARPLDLPEYQGTAIEAYRDEAWACGFASHRRAALVLARSALQALCRRYLPVRAWSSAGLGQEVLEVEKLAGPGWRAVGERVKRLADDWAHPRPSAANPPTAKETRDALNFMDEVLRFTATMERAGHLRPARWVKQFRLKGVK